MGKYLDLIGLGYLIEKIQAMFIKKTDTIPATSLAIDTTPTNNSDRLITSGGVKAALDTKQDIIDSSHKLSADLILNGTTNKVYTSTEKSKLAGIASGAEVNVQVDWNVTNTSSDAYIKNKPTIPAAQIQSDWNLTTTTSLDYIKNKPSIPITDYDIYAANLLVTNSANYITEPEVKSVKINGSSTNSASNSNCVMQYDTTNKCLKFIFN